ncbi:hypothetical protein IFR04_015100 [Cadophora malorum]|uniref:Uncharacterized protein n=1 Tax=Cadophora malorum TaxID=108018 RepID=A0A8H7W1K9_9HELO|nr:hypothetical protein IFR04_015100 [Cadophora malorum]
MDSGEIEYYITICNAGMCLEDFTVERDSPANVPFGAFPSRQNRFQCVAVPRALTKSMVYGTPLSHKEALLFDHHWYHVAVIMIPYEDATLTLTYKQPSLSSDTDHNVRLARGIHLRS